jgi:PAS domain S-box-containing protein
MEAKRGPEIKKSIGNATDPSISELAHQSGFLNHLMDSIPDIIFCKNTEGIYLTCNMAFAHHVGLSQEEIIGKTDFDIYNPKEATFYRENDRKVLAQNETGCNEEWISFPDGRRILLETSKSPYFGPDGKVSGIIGVSRDITERKRVEEQNRQLAAERTQELVRANRELQNEIAERKKSEEALRESEAKYRLLVENSYDMISTMNAERVVTYASPSWLKSLGYDTASVIGRRYQDFIHPDDMDTIEVSVDETIGSGKNLFCELRVRHTDGSWRWQAVNANPVFAADGTFISIVGISRDITENKLSEQELKESRQKLANIIEFLPDATVVVDMGNRIIAWNRAMEEMTGSKKENMIGKDNQSCTFPFYGESRPHLLDLIGISDKELESKYLYVWKKGNTLYAETYAPALNGGEGAYVWATAAPLFDVHGKRIGAIESIRDVTEQKKVAEDLLWKTTFLEALLEATVDGILVVDDDGDIILKNSHFIKLRNFPQDLCDGRDSALLRQYVTNSTINPEQFLSKVQYLYDHPDETSRDEIGFKDGMFVDRYSAPVIGKDKKYYGRIWTFRDITESKRLEDTLRKSEEKYRILAENINDSIWVIDPCSFRFTYVSPSSESISGYTPEELLDKHPDELLTPETWATARDHFEEALRTVKAGLPPELFPFDIEIIRKDGLRKWLETKYSLIYDRSGNVIAIQGSNCDITERKQALEALRESQRKLTDIINFLPDATFVIDTDGKVIAWNKAIEEMSGVKAEDILGTGNYEYALPFYGERRPILIDLVLKPVEEVEANYTEIVRRDLVLEGEAYMPALKGGKLYLYGIASILRDSKGNITGAIESIRDITARREAEEKYKNIFYNALMGIYQASPEGKITNANPAFVRLLGYDSPEKLLNNDPQTRQVFVNSEKHSELLQLMKVHGKFEQQEIELFRKDGSTAWVTINGHAVSDVSGEVIYYEGSIQDITEHKLLEMQLQQARKMEAIGTLAGGIAHDFNNILSAVIGYASMAIREPNISERLHHYHEQIYKAGIQARDLVKQILTFSRQSSEERLPLKLTPIIKEAMKLLRASIPASIEIVQNFQSERDTILSNPTQIHQILMNLCMNAVHAMGSARGTLKIELLPADLKPEDMIRQGLKPGTYIQLVVSDTGHGIPKEILHKIFDPFFTTKRPGEGTGMGLSVVHGIVKSYGGAITVQSVRGTGTKFHIYFQIIKEEEKPMETGTRIIGGKERIIFIDDEETLVDLGKNILSTLGYEVAGRTGSMEALELFRSNPDRFDLVITDMTMPNMNGLELSQELMRIRPDISVILCTGFSELITPDKARSFGIKDFIMKPILVNQIAASVRRVLDGRKED